MTTKLLHIIEANAQLDYEQFYDFDIEKIFISYYLPKHQRTDSKTEYLSLFGEDKRILDGDSCYFGERGWKNATSSFNIESIIKRDNEHHFYSKVVDDLKKSIQHCEYLIIIGAMKNTASVFLKVILDLAQEKNIKTTVLYYAPTNFLFYREAHQNQVKYFNEIVSRYDFVNYIHADLKYYDFLHFKTITIFEDSAISMVYGLTSILVNMANSNLIPKSVIYDTTLLNSIDDCIDFLGDMYCLISGDTLKNKEEILKDIFPKTIFELKKSKNLYD